MYPEYKSDYNHAKSEVKNLKKRLRDANDSLNNALIEYQTVLINADQTLESSIADRAKKGKEGPDEVIVRNIRNKVNTARIKFTSKITMIMKTLGSLR
ncbi:MAG: hypothetical protein ABIJ18_04365 [archaeon]